MKCRTLVLIQDFPTLKRFPCWKGGCACVPGRAERGSGVHGMLARLQAGLALPALPCLGKHSNQRAGAPWMTCWAYAASLGYCGRPSLLLILPQPYVPLASHRSSLSALLCFLRGAQQQVRIHACVWNNRRGPTARVTFLFKVLRIKTIKRKQPVFQSVHTKSIPFKYFLFQYTLLHTKDLFITYLNLWEKGKECTDSWNNSTVFLETLLFCALVLVRTVLFQGQRNSLKSVVSFPLAVCIQEWAYIAY